MGSKSDETCDRTMNCMDRQQHFINSLHRATADELAALSRQRLSGELGPAVDYNASWGELLVEAYYQGDADYQARFKQVLVCQLLPGRATDFVALGEAQDGVWQQTVTALQVAAGIQWQDREDALIDLQGAIKSWLHGLQQKPAALSQPRERVSLGSGFPQTDLIAALLQLVAEVSGWEFEQAEKLWHLCAADQQPPTTSLSIRARAERFWWLAYWALCRDTTDQPWLGPRVDQLSQALEAADWWPGSLTCLFLRVEARLGPDDGQQRIAELICKVPYPQDLQRRSELATQLCYFDEENRLLRADNLQSMYAETSQKTKRPKKMQLYTASQSTNDKVQQASLYTHLMRDGQLTSGRGLRQRKRRLATG
jgi:hypothetical protein